ncbi:MAG TPA: hypothetical protein VMS86_14765 [Thermoanaerobaculia bacterium]|nr:hypothetical protein [Thermoanaerobaculia bacterium]
MLTNPFRWVLAFYREDGTAVGQQPLAADWEPACEAVRFAAVRRGACAAGALASRTAVEPLWHPELGEPYVGGFRVRVAIESGGEAAAGEAAIELPSGYFREAAQRAAAALVERGELADGDRYRYVAAAFPRPEVEASPAVAFAVREVAPQLPLREGSLAAAQRGAAAWDDPCAEDPPLFVPHQALTEASELALAAGAKETGGVLIGHLRRDPRVPEIYVEVTAQLRASTASGAPPQRPASTPSSTAASSSTASPA